MFLESSNGTKRSPKSICMEGQWYPSQIPQKLFQDDTIDDTMPWKEVYDANQHVWPGKLPFCPAISIYQ